MFSPRVRSSQSSGSRKLLFRGVSCKSYKEGSHPGDDLKRYEMSIQLLMNSQTTNLD